MPYRTVTGALIQDGTVATADLADGAVTGPKIAGGAVGAAQIGAGAVETEHLCGGAVTGPKIANGAVGVGKIAAGAVGTSQLAYGLSVSPEYITIADCGGIYGPTNGDFQPARSGNVMCESTCQGNIIYCNCGCCAGCLYYFDAYCWQWKAICAC